ncbi:hypothetical protein [Nostoc sp. FACHB-888]|uniref:hypothetical protein n=1 Tax=Nostoc sp. FACHB-888 TaxID=2692842 RepID=UPI001688A1EF|nr:hypothetical protein [Nostoc sp. FACHB-888]MBD2249681.1 hypothetical protein [Nostoc sp. FACHB-888]
MSIQNQSFVTDVKLLPETDFKLIGEYAGQKLLLIGKTNGYGDPIVATSATPCEPNQEKLYAYDLYELMKCSQELLKITEKI